nr:DoxX family membrane protein [Micromonospora sp. DSM 115978]
MTTKQSTKRSIERPLEQAELPGAMLTSTAARVMAVLRISTGFVFLWAFLDKTFGFGFATPAERAWVNGGSPTKGFLSSVEVGPLQGFFHSIAGTWWANTLFMVGLAAIGVALIAGVGLRIAAGSGALMMVFMWLAEFPLDRFTASGEPAGSTNPLIDYHIVYAIVLVALAVAYAGHTWGLGRLWAKLPFVQKNRWLI